MKNLYSIQTSPTSTALECPFITLQTYLHNDVTIPNVWMKCLHFKIWSANSRWQQDSQMHFYRIRANLKHFSVWKCETTSNGFIPEIKYLWPYIFEHVEEAQKKYDGTSVNLVWNRCKTSANLGSVIEGHKKSTFLLVTWESAFNLNLDEIYLPICLVTFCFCKKFPRSMKQKVETTGKCSMEVVTCPRYPVVAIKYVRLSIMPGPPKQLNSHDVEWNIKKHYTETHWR